MKLSTPVFALVAVAALAMVLGLTVLGGAVYMAQRSRLAAQQAQQDEAARAAAQMKAQAEAALAEAQKSAPSVKPKVAARKPRRPAEVAEADQAAAIADSQEPEVKVIRSEDGSVVTMTQSKPGEYHMTATFSGNAAGGGAGSPLATLRTAQRLKDMPLTDAQRNSIDAFNKQFEQTLKQRTEQTQKAMQDAFAQLNQARADGNQQAIDAAQKQLQEAMKEQTKSMSDTDRAYAEGVKPYLTPEQALQLDKAAQAPAAAAGGMAVIQVDEGGGKSSVTIIPVQPKDTPAGAGNAAPEGAATPIQ